MRTVPKVSAAGAALAALLLLAAPASQAAEQRCGWLANPTPGNWWLTDRDATWTLRTQGASDEAEGMDLIPDLSGRDWVRVNGNYGYGCACLTVDVNRREERVTRIVAARKLPLSRCLEDKRLPGPQ